jgi:tetratricopeptide (TPR) repeat protein/CHAT domain-containing protein
MHCSCIPVTLLVVFQLTFLNQANGQESVKETFNKAKSAYYKGDYEASAEFYSNILSKDQSTVNSQLTRQNILTCYSQIGEMAWARRSYQESVFYFARALAQCSGKDALNEIPYYLFKIGRSLYALSDFTGAALVYSSALNHYSRGNTTANSRDIISLKNNLGLCQMNMGNLARANDLFRESAILAEKEGFIPEQINALNNCAILLQKDNQAVSSIEILEKCLELSGKLNDQTLLSVQKGNNGNAYMILGNYNEALDCYHESLAGMPSLPTLNNMAIAFLQIGNTDSAAAYSKFAMEMIGKSRTKGSPVPVSDFIDALGIYEEIQMERFKKEANLDELIHSFDAFREGIRYLILRMDEGYTLDYLKSFLEKHRPFFDISMQNALLIDSLSPGQIPRSALVSEAMKAVSILNPSILRSPRSGHRDQAVECLSLNSSWQLIDDFLQGKPSQQFQWNLSNAMLLDYEKDSAETFRYKTALINQVDSLEIKISEVISRLDGTTFLDYFLTSGELIIHVYSHSGIRIKRIKIPEIVISKFDELPTAVRQLDAKMIEEECSFLAGFLIQPVTSCLGSGDLVFIPDDHTIKVPFDLLPITSGSKTDYLISSRPVTYSYTLLNWQLSPGIRNRFNYAFCGLAPFIKTDSDLARPRYNLLEVTSIDSIYKSKGFPSVLLTGTSAKPDSLLDYISEARILCIATHLYQNDTLVQLNRLMMDDGSALYLPALGKINFGNELIILGVCQTLEGFSEKQVTYNSILKSFYLTGPAYCLGSLWRLYDYPFMKFNVEFNSHLISGDSYATALQKTKLSFIGSQEFSQPLFWAGIQLFERRN